MNQKRANISPINDLMLSNIYFHQLLEIYNTLKLLTQCQIVCIFISLRHNFLYADDCDLVADSQSDIQQLMDSFLIICSALCLTTSLKKWL